MKPTTGWRLWIKAYEWITWSLHRAWRTFWSSN